jgi:transglutaminase-like putative cysteine protease
MLALDDRPFDQPRPLERRLVSNCRDFSLTLVGVLRARGVPAIARPGFGTYFTPGKYEDHWIVQVWEGERWRWIDPHRSTMRCEPLYSLISTRSMCRRGAS